MVSWIWNLSKKFSNYLYSTVYFNPVLFSWSKYESRRFRTGPRLSNFYCRVFAIHCSFNLFLLQIRVSWSFLDVICFRVKVLNAKVQVDLINYSPFHFIVVKVLKVWWYFAEVRTCIRWSLLKILLAKTLSQRRGLNFWKES